jgi:site-specific recombinase XerD
MNALPVPITPAAETAPVWGWVRVRALVLDSVSSPHSRRVYGTALDDFWGWCQRAAAGGFTRETVQRYRAELEASGRAPSTLNLHLTVLRKLAREAAAAITAVKGKRQKGVRLGTWLSLEEAQALLRAPGNDSLRARRDRALLALLIGCGLRRAELARLELASIQPREGRWVIVDLEGKGSRTRSVPMPAWTKSAIDCWAQAAGITQGCLLRGHLAEREVAENLTAQAVYLIVKQYAVRLGVPVAPHDLRRTFAKLAHRGRAPLEQIQLSLGHESILTTERYLGVRQNLTDAPCDHLGLELENA